MPDLPVVRRAVRAVVSSLPIRGRHRFIAAVAPYISSGTEIVRIGGLNVEIDHDLSFCRAMYYGLYEPHLTNWIRFNVRADDAVIEPGVNVGFITGHLLQQVGNKGLVIALEPSRRCAEQLHRNNDIAAIPSLRFVNAAMADVSGEDTYYETSRIVSHGYGCLGSVEQPEDGTSYSIPTRSVDDLMDEYSLEKVRFLKLDIEGAELIALQGASQALAAGRIDHVMVETTIDHANADSKPQSLAIAKILESSGFRSHSMRRNGTLRPLNLGAIGQQPFRSDVMWSRR